LLAASKAVWITLTSSTWTIWKNCGRIPKRRHQRGASRGDDDWKYRDLKGYYEKKLSLCGNAGERKLARHLLYEPLKVCQVNEKGNELCQPGTSKKLAVAANLLATSIVLNVDTETLQKVKQTLERHSISKLEALLKRILTKGDVIESTRCPKLELKNFGNLPLSEQGRAECIAKAENAYRRALDLLSIMKCNLVTGLPDRFKQTFKDYFGDPDAKVDVGKLGFHGGAPPTLTGSPTRAALVRAVLDCVWQGLQTRPVRLYFGGGTIIPDVKAYTNQKVRNLERINVHLAYGFFAEHGVQAIKGDKSSRAGVLIHEFTHALAGTLDVNRAFSAFRCKQLAEQGQSALANAQNYAFFVEDALG
jgi:Lysine-specific metallo-endopeptidase